MMRNALSVLGLTLMFSATGCKERAHQAPAPSVVHPVSLALDYSPSPEDVEIAAAMDQVRAEPGKAENYARLAGAFLARKRETADSRLLVYAQSALSAGMSVGQSSTLLVAEALLLQEQHRFSEVRDIGRRLVRMSPDDATAHLLIGDAELELGDYEAAELAYQRALDLSPDVRTYSRGAHLCWLHGDWDGARELMEDALQAGARPEPVAWVWVDFGSMLLHRGEIAAARNAARRAQQLIPDYVPSLQLMARINAAEGQWHAAVAALETVTSRAPSAESWLRLSDAYRAVGDTSAAATARARARAHQRHDPLPVARDLARKNIDSAAALELAERAVASRSTIESLDTYALALWRNGRLDDALAAATRATARGTLDANLFLHRALIEASVGDGRRAMATLAEAVAINPDVDPDLRKELEISLENTL